MLFFSPPVAVLDESGRKLTQRDPSIPIASIVPAFFFHPYLSTACTFQSKIELSAVRDRVTARAWRFFSISGT